ncbi:repressor protein C [Metarhizobium album]|uniref:Repressor protein C n=2 Tax=Metarhizobium album TaxID=2182425 RepID=A0A2U2DGD2_9HYPH|nr:repressor protein C [Rhizobium album]
MAQRLVEARIAAGFSRRSDALNRFTSWSPSTYASHELGRRRFDSDFAEKYAVAFKVPVSHLLAHDLYSAEETKPTSNIVRLQRPRPNASFPPIYQSFNTESTLPLLGQTTGGPNGRFILNGSEVGRVFCPPMLEGVEGAYAVRVFGTSMEPRFKAGETVWINPHEPVRAKDDVVVQLLTDGEDQPTESYIKEFRSQSSKVLRLWQHNPDEDESHEMVFDNEDVFSVHKIVFHAV